MMPVFRGSILYLFMGTCKLRWKMSIDIWSTRCVLRNDKPQFSLSILLLFKDNLPTRRKNSGTSSNCAPRDSLACFACSFSLRFFYPFKTEKRGRRKRSSAANQSSLSFFIIIIIFLSCTSFNSNWVSIILWKFFHYCLHRGKIVFAT